MKCCRCGRSLGKVRFVLEGKPIGPECYAKESGASVIPKRKRLSKKKAKNPKFIAPEIERCPNTLEMFDDE